MAETSGRSLAKIPIARFDFSKGEQTAHACDIA